MTELKNIKGKKKPFISKGKMIIFTVSFFAIYGLLSLAFDLVRVLSLLFNSPI